MQQQQASVPRETVVKKEDLLIIEDLRIDIDSSGPSADDVENASNNNAENAFIDY